MPPRPWAYAFALWASARLALAAVIRPVGQNLELTARDPADQVRPPLFRRGFGFARVCVAALARHRALAVPPSARAQSVSLVLELAGPSETLTPPTIAISISSDGFTATPPVCSVTPSPVALSGHAAPRARPMRHWLCSSSSCCFFLCLLLAACCLLTPSLPGCWSCSFPVGAGLDYHTAFCRRLPAQVRSYWLGLCHHSRHSERHRLCRGSRPHPAPTCPRPPTRSTQPVRSNPNPNPTPATPASPSPRSPKQSGATCSQRFDRTTARLRHRPRR